MPRPPVGYYPHDEHALESSHQDEEGEGGVKRVKEAGSGLGG